jgi:hypothetical protein
MSQDRQSGPQIHEPTIREMSLRDLQSQLGMNRSADDLGFADTDYDGCRIGVRGDNGQCGRRFLSVVNFRLVCRDTVGTTTRVPNSLTPLSKSMEWRLGGARGHVRTDSQGYGQVQMVSSRPVKSDRFMLIIGSKILGLEAGEVSQIVLPGNWCGHGVAMR